MLSLGKIQLRRSAMQLYFSGEETYDTQNLEEETYEEEIYDTQNLELKNSRLFDNL